MPNTPARYTYGGDEHLFVELDEAMSLEAFYRGLLITRELAEMDLPGVTEICPANASYLIRFNPDILDVVTLQEHLERIDAGVDVSDAELNTRIVEIPVFYQDPWTHETLMKFRNRHQDPNSTDIEYAARINGFEDAQGFIDAHSAKPWFVSMVGFVAGLPFMYQMVPRDKQLQVPKYLSPRTETPKQTVGHGGAFAAIYSVRGAGGYQMFGVTPMPIFDPKQELHHLRDSMIFFSPGDIVKFKPVTREEHDAIVADSESGNYRVKSAKVTFSFRDFAADQENYPTQLVEALNVH